MEWINKLWALYTMKYYTQQMRKNELLQHPVIEAYNDSLSLMLHVYCRLAEALLPVITNQNPIWQNRLYLEYYQFGDKEKRDTGEHMPALKFLPESDIYYFYQYFIGQTKTYGHS